MPPSRWLDIQLLSMGALESCILRESSSAPASLKVPSGRSTRESGRRLCSAMAKAVRGGELRPICCGVAARFQKKSETSHYHGPRSRAPGEKARRNVVARLGHPTQPFTLITCKLPLSSASQQRGLTYRYLDIIILLSKAGVQGLERGLSRKRRELEK